MHSMLTSCTMLLIRASECVMYDVLIVPRTCRCVGECLTKFSER